MKQESNQGGVQQKVDKKLLMLIKDAHNHGFGIAASGLDWGLDKSWNEFVKQNNLNDVSLLSFSDRANIASKLRKSNRSIRQIAKIMGYKHPGSISYLLKNQ